MRRVLVQVIVPVVLLVGLLVLIWWGRQQVRGWRRLEALTLARDAAGFVGGVRSAGVSWVDRSARAEAIADAKTRLAEFQAVREKLNAAHVVLPAEFGEAEEATQELLADLVEARARERREKQEHTRLARVEDEARRTERLEVIRENVLLVRAARDRAFATLGALRGLSPRAFELVLARAYETQGWNVVVTPASNDEGRDVIVERAGEKLFVECKRYGGTSTVGRPDVQKLYGAVKAEGATGGVVATTGRLTKAARAFVGKAGVQVLEGEKLVAFVRQAPMGEDLPPVCLTCPDCRTVTRFTVGSHGGSWIECRACGGFLPHPYEKTSPDTVSVGENVLAQWAKLVETPVLVA